MNVKDKILIESINAQKKKIEKIKKKRDKVFVHFPKSMYNDDSRKHYLNGYDKDIERCNNIISKIRVSLNN